MSKATSGAGEVEAGAGAGEISGRFAIDAERRAATVVPPTTPEAEELSIDALEAVIEPAAVAKKPVTVPPPVPPQARSHASGLAPARSRAPLAAAPVVEPEGLDSLRPFYKELEEPGERAQVDIADLSLQPDNPYLASSLVPPAAEPRAPGRIVVGAAVVVAILVGGYFTFVRVGSAPAEPRAANAATRVEPARERSAPTVVAVAPAPVAPAPTVVATPVAQPAATEATVAAKSAPVAAAASPAASAPAAPGPAAVEAKPAAPAAPAATVAAVEPPPAVVTTPAATTTPAASVAATSAPAAAEPVGAAPAAVTEITAAPATPTNLPATPTREEVAAGFDALRPDLLQCAAGKAGVVVIDATIAGAGRVAYALVDGTAFKGTPEGSCMARAIRKAHFPQFAQESLKVRYPVQL